VLSLQPLELFARLFVYARAAPEDDERDRLELRSSQGAIRSRTTTGITRVVFVVYSRNPGMSAAWAS
jgi:hypothetical protein